MDRIIGPAAAGLPDLQLRLCKAIAIIIRSYIYVAIKFGKLISVTFGTFIDINNHCESAYLTKLQQVMGPDLA